MRAVVSNILVKNRYLPESLVKDSAFSFTNADLIKARIKGHYRKLPNGKIIFIKEHRDKRKDFKKDPKKFRHKVIHSDDQSTTYVNHEGKEQKFKHQDFNELDQESIHGHLNSALHIDKNLAMKVWASENGIKDINAYLDDLVDEEKKAAEETQREPEFKNREGALKHLTKHTLKDVLKDLEESHGEVTTYAKAATHFEGGRGRLAEHFHDIANDEDVNEHDRSMAKMATEHSESAVKAYEEELAAIKQAKKAKPEDCPHIDSIGGDIKFFGHQAQTLAQLNLLKKSIIDVDMGGGKGLILPADAMNLMSQGKVKKPLIIVPGATLEQNALKTIEYSEGQMNVFKIDNETIKEVYDGDMEKLLEDVNKAPPNTIFMASYDVFAYQDRKKKAGEGEDDFEQEFPRAKALGAAGFDYASLDESHNIKNPQSQRFKALQHLTHIPYKRVASGTFISNNPQDVVGQLTFLHPHTSMKPSEFLAKYGKEETGKGIKWDKSKLKELREDLQNMGMISLRRSAWLHLLPKRNEMPSIVKMEPKLEKAHEVVLNEMMDEIEAEMAKDPRIKKLLAGDGDDDSDDELPPNVLGPLNLIQSVTDHPDELANMLESDLTDLKTLKDELREKGMDTSEINEAIKGDEENNALKERLQRLSKPVKQAILSLKGMVSPKAKDVYKKLDEHFADKKNGKFMVFVQRKASARHILDNMPEQHKKSAMYFDASQMDKLKEFTQDPNGPKIIVAVDASIKEGVNMQIANGQYRYDHHYVPGNQEQGYARIWRFGQDKPANIHLGIVDNGVDVTKYARLISKLHTNMMVTSDMDDDDTFEAYKLNLDNIRNNRSAGILDQYFDMNKRILDHQMGENKELQKKFGSKPISRVGKKKIGGKNAKKMHGFGPYQSDVNTNREDVEVGDKDLDSLLGHTRDQLVKNNAPEYVYNFFHPDPEEDTSEYFEDAYKLMMRHKARGGGDKIDPHTIDQYEHESGDEFTDKRKKMYESIINNTLSGKKHTPHDKHDHIHAVDLALKMSGKKGVSSAEKKKFVGLAKELNVWLKNKKIELEMNDSGNVVNRKLADKWFEQFDVDAKDKWKLGVIVRSAAHIAEVSGGIKSIKNYFPDLQDHAEDEEKPTRKEKMKKK